MTATIARPELPEVSTPWQGSGLFTQIWVLTGRSLRPVLRDPKTLVFSLMQPLLMLVLFSQVFRVIAEGPMFPKGVAYIDYLLPAIMVTTATMVGVQAGVGLTSDMKNGVLARFRSMPVSPVAVLIARSVADLTRGLIELVVMLIAAALLFGFAPAGGLLGVIGALLLALAVGWSLGWLFLAAAAWLRESTTAQMVGMMALFPLQFASSAFVPIQSLPGWLQVVAEVNPISYAINAARDLALNNPVGSGVTSALVVSAGIAVVGAVLAERGFRRP
ncbi:ABC transporter permease [Crossiella cryophila]|uniref:Transport permease protein n=1 Tax=Crossiella cryophila TaxID=43355 RepID=A0A7W7CAR1_9PSEU|nr:ABC transporter permease [Crossiella cryophila]MBB4676234.1 ABC-2 type transport system permease protein [Crossiella cryophila]